MALLEVRNLNRHFGGLHAVSDVSFDVSDGMIKAVIGPNGAGKTTLFNLILGSLRPNSGSIIYKGESIFGYQPYRIAGLGISRTYQNIKLFPHMTVKENVMVGRHTRGRAGFISAMLNTPKAWNEEREIEARSMELIEMLGIADLADAEAGSLAFGKQRAVEFARALATDPKFLLLDEPAAGLNIYETREIAELIKKIRDLGITILIIEHDMSLVMDISDEIAVLSYGKKIAEGTPSAIQKNPEVVRVYLGEDDA
jgi:branched-chain amino acid transport system ATP-binding protein